MPETVPSGRHPNVVPPQLGGPLPPDPDRQLVADDTLGGRGPGHMYGTAPAAGRSGLPASAAGPGREEAVAGGLYGGDLTEGGRFRLDRSRPELRPEVPAGEVDSWTLPAPGTARHLAAGHEPEAGA